MNTDRRVAVTGQYHRLTVVETAGLVRRAAACFATAPAQTSPGPGQDHHLARESPHVPGIRHPVMISGMPVATALAEIDATAAEQLRAALLHAADRGHATIVADLARTRICDSAGLTVLVRAHKRAVAEGGEPHVEQLRANRNDCAVGAQPPPGPQIAELSRRTQIRAALLRTWESRYGLLRLARTAAGYRAYTDADEQRVLRMQAFLARDLSTAETART